MQDITRKNADDPDRIPSFTFQYKKYTSFPKLVEALGSDWENGKRRLYNGKLRTFFQKVNPKIAYDCQVAEVTGKVTEARKDYAFFRLLYQMYPAMGSFHWRDYHFQTMNDLGVTILHGIRANSQSVWNMVDEFIREYLFSTYESVVSSETRANKLHSIEKAYLSAKQKGNSLEWSKQAFLLSYQYTSEKVLITNMRNFRQLEEFSGFAVDLLQNDPDGFASLSEDLFVPNPNAGSPTSVVPTPQFSAWLTVLGQEAVLS